MNVDAILVIASLMLIIDAGWGIYIKYKLMTQHKKLFICDSEGGNCEPA